MERFKRMRLQPIWGNRCNSEPYQKWLFLPLNQRPLLLKHREVKWFCAYRRHLDYFVNV